MAGSDLRTKALVLKRTNYGETDRILNVLTPEGKMSVLAKGARREKSKLAGGIEMFSLSEIVVHQGRSELAVLTAAKMLEFYQDILTDLVRLEAASEILKRVSRVAEQITSQEHFSITVQALRALNGKQDMDIVMAWFYFNLARISGEEVNLYTDTNGEKLRAEENYTWDVIEKTLRPADLGKISGNEIKMIRLMLTAELSLVLSVKNTAEMALELLHIAKAVNQM